MMKTFKMFIAEMITPDFFIKLIQKTLDAHGGLHVDDLHYRGDVHNGLVVFAAPGADDEGDGVEVWYDHWDEDMRDYTGERSFLIHESDLDMFAIKTMKDGAKGLIYRGDRVRHESKSVNEERAIYAKKIEDAPAWSPAQAEGDYKIGDVTFSASNGLGSVPSNQNVWYEGFVAMMKPSVFLSLALSDEGRQDQTSVEIEDLIKQGYAIGIPFLSIEFDDSDDALFNLPIIRGHEGRGRMKAIKRVLGDAPIPVHFFLRGGMRSRHLTPDMIKKLKMGIMAERSKSIVRRPVETVWVNGEEV